MNGERFLSMHIIKARGLKHSNKVMRFSITDQGLELSETDHEDHLKTGAQKLLDNTNGNKKHNIKTAKKR